MFVNTGCGEVFCLGDLFDGHPVNKIHNRNLSGRFLFFCQDKGQKIPGRGIILLIFKKRGVVQDIQVFVQGMFPLVPNFVQADIGGYPVQQG